MTAKPDPIPVDLVGAEMGRRLKVEREAANLSQAELSRRCGGEPTATAISNYENGLRRFNQEFATTLERVLGKPAAYFMAVVSEQEAAVLLAMRGRKRP